MHCPFLAWAFRFWLWAKSWLAPGGLWSTLPKLRYWGKLRRLISCDFCLFIQSSEKICARKTNCRKWNRHDINWTTPTLDEGAEILELIGFYRSVHGETAAIINAARLGISIKGAMLYVTAFPCHECARHILAAGIEGVFYIEPYPKSLAGVHYPESIVIDEAPANDELALYKPGRRVLPRVIHHWFI